MPFRFSFIVAAFLLCFSQIPAFADDIVAESRISAATVYTSRATVTRQAVVDIPAGSHTVVFNNLPAGLLPDSLRTEGKAAASVTFGALTSRMVMEAELAAPREKELADKLEVLQDQRKTVEAEKHSLSARREFLTSLSQQASLRAREDIAEINLKPDQWSAAAQVVYAGVSEILKAQLEQDTKLRTLDRQIAQMQNELNQIRTGQRSWYQVTLPLETDTATSLTVDLSYQIPDATWTPVYDARLDTKEGKLELVQYGSVSQTSGEDWTGVNLTLSTAQPQRGTGLPDLQSMWVNIMANVQVMRGRMDKSMAAGAGAEFGAVAMSEVAMDAVSAPAAEMVMQEAQFEHATIETGGFVSEYKIPGPATVKADGTESKLMIGTFDTENKVQVQIKPQMSTDAYLVSRSKLKGEAPILPGPVSLFRDGAYVGQSSLPLLRPGEESDLAFGIDDQVSVKRRVMKDERGEAGVINRDETIERHFVTEIQNLHAQPVDIAVLETVPVAQDEQITASIITDATTPGYEKDSDKIKGLLRWTLNVASKEKTEVKLGWKVSWPKDQSLSGL